MASVSLKALVKEYPGEKGAPAFRAVDAIDLEIRDGEFMVFVGPSGCGKSTTLRMIAGLESVTGGDVFIGHRRVNAVAPKDRDISMVFQSYALYPHKTVYGNLAFGLEMMGFRKTEVKTRVGAVAESLGLTTMLGRKPSALSGGQRQRVALGRAIVRQPKVFLFDEPLSNLDAKMRVSTRQEISSLHKRLKTTMVYVTHDQVEAMTMGDRICVMNGGNIMQVDTPLNLFNAPANLFVAGFIGSPAMNFFSGHIQTKGTQTFFVETNPNGRQLNLALTANLSRRVADYQNKPVILGIRPESITSPKSVLPDTPTINVQSQLKLAEPMGKETFLHLDTGAHTFTARVDSEFPYSLEGMVNLAVQTNEIHFFDPTSEERIT